MSSKDGGILRIDPQSDAKTRQGRQYFTHVSLARNDSTVQSIGTNCLVCFETKQADELSYEYERKWFPDCPNRWKVGVLEQIWKEIPTGTYYCSLQLWYPHKYVKKKKIVGAKQIKQHILGRMRPDFLMWISNETVTIPLHSIMNVVVQLQPHSHFTDKQDPVINEDGITSVAFHATYCVPESPDTATLPKANLTSVQSCGIQAAKRSRKRPAPEPKASTADALPDSTVPSNKANNNNKKQRRVTIDDGQGRPTLSKKQPPQSTITHPRVVGQPLYKHRLSNNDKLYFFDHLFMTPTWTVRVGDLVAVACSDATTNGRPIYSMSTKSRKKAVPKKQSGWYPFVQPWSAAQVLAIYVTQSNQLHVQIRWFYRPHELPPDEVTLNRAQRTAFFACNKAVSGRHLIEVDECVQDVLATHILGLVTATSKAEPTVDFLNNYRNGSVRVLPVMVRHFFSMERFSGDESLTRVSDWDNNYCEKASAPYQRGMNCAKGFPGKIKGLFLAYGGRNEATKSSNQDDSMPSESEESDQPTTEWPTGLLDVYPLAPIPQRNLLHKSNDQEYFRSVSIQSLVRRCDRRATAKKTTDLQWDLHIGQLVCIAFSDVPVRVTNSQKQKNIWYPFVGPWKYCQVLNIYRKGGGIPKLEVRFFLRRSELPPEVLGWMPSPVAQAPENVEEVYETDSVLLDVPVTRVLGHATIFLGHLDRESNPPEGTMMEIPSYSCRCRYYYHTEQMRFQPIYCSSVDPRAWFQRILERGFKTSGIVQNDADLGQMIEFCSDVRLAASSGHELSSTWMDFGQQEEIPKAAKLCDEALENSDRHFFVSCSIAPQWNKYAKAEVVCPLKDRRGLRWTVCVGDIVAIESSNSNQQRKNNCFPYSVGWRPGQVLAIYKDDCELDYYHLQIRWFYRSCDATLLQGSLQTQNLDLIYSTNEVDSKAYTTNILLGPVSVLPSKQHDLRICHGSTIWNSVCGFLPAAPYLYAGHFDVKQQQKVKAPPLDRLVRSGLQLSGLYGNASNKLDRLYTCVKREVGRIAERGQTLQLTMQLFLHDNASDDNATLASSDSPRRKPRETRVWTSAPPFYVDRSSRMEYIVEIEIEPPYESYSIDVQDARKQKAIWSVRIGDVVMLHHQGKTGGRYTYVHHRMKEGKPSSTQNFPFLVGSAVGQVVTIRRESDSAHCDSITIEIRWFYRQSEIPGSTVAKTSSDLYCEELFESDAYDEVSPSSLLAPVCLYKERKGVQVGKTLHGMPVIEFYCCRFWSSTRKCMLPVGGLDGMTARAHSRSQVVKKDPSLRLALQRLVESDADSDALRDGEKANFGSDAEKMNWRHAFSSVAEKLSLTDASKEANCNGDALVGREKERGQILSFLRVSIAGHAGESTKPCLFVAGPPGTGKTASIRATINELQRGKQTGKVPAFEFISLNGMEMRHPFDAYSKLWEEISDGSASVAGEAAASKLEAYFSGKSCSPSDHKRIFVVLLDEIDYLVTKKQTVLYNFFDWPSRSASRGSMHRLIVIGVSNTLNLPERLQPRVQSRMGSKRIFFKSYNVDETVQILKAKMTQASPNYAVFDRDAVLYAAKKTAALSGDIRKAFHICRSAAEMMLNETKDSSTDSAPVVRIKDVLKVSRESFNSAQSRSVTLCATFEALLLVSLASLGRTTGREYGGFDVEEISTKMTSIADALGKPLYLPPPCLMETLGIISRLGEMRLVSLETPRSSSLSYRATSTGTGGAWPIVSLAVDDLAVLVALKETPHNELAQKYLSRHANR